MKPPILRQSSSVNFSSEPPALVIIPTTPKLQSSKRFDGDDSESPIPNSPFSRQQSRSSTPGTSRRPTDLNRTTSFKLSRQSSRKSLLISQAGQSPATPKRVSTPVTESMSSPGTGSLLHSYVGEVYETTSTAILRRQKSNAVIEKSDDLTFDDQIELAMNNDIPYVSKAKKLKSFWPMHTSERRYRIIDLGKRLKRNDGGLIRLRLSSEGIDDELLHIISENLYTNTLVQHIMLNNNKITDNGIKKLVKGLRRHPAIHTLWLGGNLISDRGVLYLCELCRHNKRVKELNLSNRWPELRWESSEHSEHPRITADGAALLAELLATHHSHGESIHNLSLNQQRIQDRGASLLFRAIPMSHLRTLSLSDNLLTDACCPALRDLLSAPHANLEYLNLSRNRLSDAGIRLLAPSLQSNRILAACDLSYNAISQVGFDLLLDALYSNSTMRTMSLHNNLNEDTTIEIFLKNRLVNTVRSHLEKSGDEGISGAIGNAEINAFLKSEGLLTLPGGLGAMGMEEERGGSGEEDEIQSIDSFGATDSTAKHRPLTSNLGSSGYVPKMIRDRAVGLGSQESNETVNTEATEESKRFRQHVVASRLLADSSSNLGAFGKSLPSRAPREGSPMAQNPFQSTAPASSSHSSSSLQSSPIGKSAAKRDGSRMSQMSLIRCPSADLHLHSEESLLGCSFESTGTDSSSLRADTSAEAEINSGDPSEDLKRVSRPTQKLALYRSLSSQFSLETSAGGRGEGEGREEEKPLSATEALTAKYISKQDSFDFEYSDEGEGHDDDQSQYLVLKKPSPEDQQVIAKKYRPSHALGKITGVPSFASFGGSQPIRSATQRHRDSCNHLMYLQVLTPADPPGTQPYPVVMIGADHRETLKKIKDYRQTPAYKQKKRNAVLYNKVPLLKESMEALPPSTFWSQWSQQVCMKYPDGIDRTSGCQSVATLMVKEDPKQLEVNKMRTRRRQMAQQVDNLIEKQKEKVAQRNRDLQTRRQSALLSASTTTAAASGAQQQLQQEGLGLGLGAPKTHISEKYAGETSQVGVGEMYRRTLVNVTASVDKKRLMMNEITTENLLGLRVNQKVADIVR